MRSRVDEAGIREENELLRAELEAYRQRELADLRQQLAEAKASAEHYRSEARNADLGRKIAAEYQLQIAELRAKLDAYEEVESRVRRLGTSA